MKRVEAILLVTIALTLSGCVLRGKPAVTPAAAPVVPKPVPPPTPDPPAQTNLSIPQTNQELPQAQALTLEAINSTQAPEETPTIVPTRPPKPQGKKAGSPPAATQARSTEPPVGPTTPPAAAAAPQPTPVEPERPDLQEILPAAEANRLHGEATRKKQEIAHLLQQVKKRKLSTQELDIEQQIQSCVNLSDEAQRKGDMRKAFDLADKGLVLAKALSGGR